MVTKKKGVKKKVSNQTLKFDKNILSIVLGGISSIGALLVPSIFSIFGIAGLLLAYENKKEKSNKLNKWGFYLSIAGIVLSVVFMTLALFYMASILQSIPQ